jgi:hypothetical protein
MIKPSFLTGKKTIIIKVKILNKSVCINFKFSATQKNIAYLLYNSTLGKYLYNLQQGSIIRTVVFILL